MLQYTTINDGLLAHLNELIEEGATNPGHDQDISSVLMAIAKVMKALIPADEDEEDDNTDPDPNNTDPDNTDPGNTDPDNTDPEETTP